MEIQKAIDNIKSFLKWHKDTKSWLDPDRPFETVNQYMLILGYYEDIDNYQAMLDSDKILLKKR